MTKNQGFGIVVLMCLGIFVCMIDTTIMNIALPAIQTNLNATLETMSWILNVYTMSIAVLSIPLARMAEIFGKAKFFLLGALLFGVGSALCGFSTTGEFLIAARFIQSVGASILMPVSMIIGVSAVPVEKRHLALGILGSTQGLAAALGPAVGGIITQTLGWSWVFYVNVPICLISVVLGARKLHIRQEERTHVSIDYPGVLLSSLTIFAVTLVLIKGNAWGWSSDEAIACYIISAISCLSFILVERKVKNPMVNLALFRNRQFTGATLAMMAATVCMVGVTVLLPQFLTRFQGKTELAAALLVTPVSATIFFIAPVSGTLARKIGNFFSVFVGFLSLGMSYVLLKNLSLDATMLQVVAICILVGAGFGCVIGPASMASAADFEGELLTASQSVTQMFRQVGVVLAVAIFVSELTYFLGVQKQEVINYATTKVATMDVPANVKSTMLAEFRKRLQNSEMTADTDSSSSRYVMSEADRQKLIEENVSRALANVPAAIQEKARPQVTAQVTQKVDEDIHKISSEVNTTSADLKQHAKETMALAFSKLYQTGVPVVFATVFLSFLFVNRRKHAEAKAIVA